MIAAERGTVTLDVVRYNLLSVSRATKAWKAVFSEDRQEAHVAGTDSVSQLN